MAEIVQLHDEEADVDVFPVVHADGIYNNDGEKVIDKLEEQITTLNTNLKDFEFVLDDTGKIIGYKTSKGGDTVFDFDFDSTSKREYSDPIRESATAIDSGSSQCVFQPHTNYRVICYHCGTNSSDRNGWWYLKKEDGTVVRSILLGSEVGGTNSTYGYFLLDPEEAYYVHVTTRYGFCYSDHWYA